MERREGTPFGGYGDTEPLTGRDPDKPDSVSQTGFDGRDTSESRTRPHERMQTMSIPADPLDGRFLPQRFANVMTQIERVWSWMETENEPRDTHALSLDARAAQREEWARENHEEAQYKLEQCVWMLEDVCRAFRSRETGTYLRAGTRNPSETRGRKLLRRGHRRSRGEHPLYGANPNAVLQAMNEAGADTGPNDSST